MISFLSMGFVEDWWIIIFAFFGFYLCVAPAIIMAFRGLLISYIDEEYITSKFCGKTIKKMHWTEIKYIKCVTSSNYSGENYYPFLLISAEPIEYIKHFAMKYNYKYLILIKLGNNAEEIVNVFNRKLALSMDLNEIRKMKSQDQIEILSANTDVEI